MTSTTVPSSMLSRDFPPHRHIELLSQGEVRPGIRQGQHWGVPPRAWTVQTPPPVPVCNINTDIP